MNDFRCDNCTIPIDKDTAEARKRRKHSHWNWCIDCIEFGLPIRQQIQWTHPLFGRMVCNPYKGEVDDQFRPIRPDGMLYKPGVRICGFSDCVYTKHIILPEETLYGVSALVKKAYELTGQLFLVEALIKETPAHFMSEQGLLRGGQ